jgi:mono/diheme cytochrome c family protein
MRVHTRLAMVAVALGVWGIGGAVAQTAASGGRKLAETFCNACHQVGNDASLPSPNPDAPSFAQIARMPAMNDLAIRVFLRSPHSSMPNFLLSDTDIDEAIAYIRTLGAP